MLKAQRCDHCEKKILWGNEVMLIPDNVGTIPMPNSDMPEDSAKWYDEARSIVNKSPAGACALLRLSLQCLMPHIGGEGKNINTDIATLVKNGLSDKIQQALDTCRVIGNEAVHPGQIDFKDTPEIANKIFMCLNFIVDEMISKPREIESAFEDLPDDKKKHINDRDKK